MKGYYETIEKIVTFYKYNNNLSLSLSHKGNLQNALSNYKGLCSYYVETSKYFKQRHRSH